MGTLLREWQSTAGEEEFVVDAAERLATIAHENGLNPAYESPFAAKARDAGKAFSGGKLDDVTVVVGVISES
jgi:hypothetical protein